MPNFQGELTEVDALRLLRTLRFVRKIIREETGSIIVGQATQFVTADERRHPLIPDETLDLSLDNVLDLIMRDYRDYE